MTCWRTSWRTVHLTCATPLAKMHSTFEDGYILITGEDFDSNEASRTAAGGFIVLELLQVGKVFKLVKGAKILTKTGTVVNATKRVIKQ